MDDELKKYMEELSHLKSLGILPADEMGEIDKAMKEIEKLSKVTEPNTEYKLQIKFVNKTGQPNPEYAKVGDSGFDLRATEGGELGPLERKLVPTGLYFELPDGYDIEIRSRSGLSLKNGVIVLNSPGTVDGNYRGELGVILINLGKETFKWSVGDRIAQALIRPAVTDKFVELVEVVEINETERGEGGFGSTGTK